MFQGGVGLLKKPIVIGIRPGLDAAFAATEVLATQADLNTGHIVGAHAICSHIRHHTAVLDIRTPSELINRAGDIAVVQAANQLGAHFTNCSRADRMAQLEIDVVAIGLGAQSEDDATVPDLPTSVVEWVRRIVERAPSKTPNLGVRGEFTVQVLEAYGFDGCAEVVGCPSLFLNPDPNLGRQIAQNIREPRRVAVAAGNENSPKLSRIEASLARLVTATNGAYIGQHGLTMMKLTRGEAEQIGGEDLSWLRDYICPGMSLVQFAHWSQTYGNVFFDVSNWIEYCRRFDFVVGTRIHGTAIALQAGVPALCIAHDSRTLELCRTMKIPYVQSNDVADGIELDQLLRLVDFDPLEFDKNRRALCRTYVQFLRNNLLRPASWLEALGLEA